MPECTINALIQCSLRRRIRKLLTVGSFRLQLSKLPPVLFFPSFPPPETAWQATIIIIAVEYRFKSQKIKVVGLKLSCSFGLLAVQGQDMEELEFSTNGCLKPGIHGSCFKAFVQLSFADW